MFLSPNPSKPYFIPKFWSLGRSGLDQKKVEQVSNLNSTSFERFSHNLQGLNPALWPGPTRQPSPPLS
jgi:hypothetical protein